MGHAIGRSGLGIACHIFNEAPFFFSNILWWNGLLRGLNRATAALSDPLFSVFIVNVSHKMLIFTWKTEECPTLFKIASNDSQPPLERPKHVKCEKSAEALGWESQKPPLRSSTLRVRPWRPSPFFNESGSHKNIGRECNA